MDNQRENPRDTLRNLKEEGATLEQIRYARDSLMGTTGLLLNRGPTSDEALEAMFNGADGTPVTTEGVQESTVQEEPTEVPALAETPYYHPWYQELVTPTENGYFSRVTSAYAPQRPFTEGSNVPVREDLGEVDSRSLIADAITQGSTLYNLVDWATRKTFEAEPGFSSDDRLAYYDQVPQEYYASIATTSSHAEAEYTVGRIQESLAAQQHLYQEHGFAGFASVLAAGLFDPLNLMTVGGELKVFHSLAKGAGRLGRTGAGVGVGATSGSLYSAPMYANDRMTSEEMMMSAVLGAAIGGVGAQFGTGALANDTRKVYNDVAKEAQARPATGTVGAAKVSTVEKSIPMSGGAEGIARNITSWSGRYGSDVRNMQNSKVFKSLEAVPLLRDVFSDSFQMARTDIDGLHHFMYEMLGGVPSGQMTNVNSVADLSRNFRDQHMGEVMPTYHHNRDIFRAQWAKANGKNSQTTKVFSKEADEAYDKAVRLELEARRNAFEADEMFVPSTDPTIARTAEVWEQGMNSAFKKAQDAGLMKEFSYKPGYVPLKWKAQDIRALPRAERLEYQELLEQGYRNVGLSEESSQIVAQAVMDRAVRKGSDMDSNPTALFNADSRAYLEEILQDGGYQSSKIQGLLEDIESRFTRQAETGFMKGRTSIDLTVESSTGKTLLDLVDNSLENLSHSYYGQMGGRTALARKGLKTQADINDYKNAIMNEVNLKRPDEFDKWSTVLDSYINGIQGRNISRGGAGVNDWARRLMGMTYLNMMGKMGFSQAAETGQLLGRHGMGAFMKAVPEANRQMKALKAGETNVLSEYAALAGRGWDDPLIFRPTMMGETTNGAVINQLDRAIHKGQYAMGTLSGFNKVRQQQNAAGVLLEFDAMARVTKKYALWGDIPTSQQRRLGTMGVNEGNFSMIRRNFHGSDGTPGHVQYSPDGSIDRLNTDKWSQLDAETVINSVNRTVNQAIQSGNLGESNTLLSGTAGALFGQFLGFPLMAMEKQLARSIHIADPEAMITFVATYSTAMLAMMARHSVDLASGDMSETELVARAMSYTSHLGLLPTMTDMTVAMGISPEGMYSGNIGRNGPSMNPDLLSIFSPAAVSTLRDTVGGATKTIKSLNPVYDYDMTDTDLDQIRRATWFNNTVPGQILFSVGEGE